MPIMTCEQCKFFINRICTDESDCVDEETGEPMCPFNLRAISREDWLANLQLQADDDSMERK